MSMLQFDEHNKIVQLCVQGMMLEGEGKMDESFDLFQKAWDMAGTNFEKFIAAHYLARRQDNITGKLEWDKTALNIALEIEDESIKASYPSLYLNIGKCYEDMGAFENAGISYNHALSFALYLDNDGYGKMICAGIENGLARIKQHTKQAHHGPATH